MSSIGDILRESVFHPARRAIATASDETRVGSGLVPQKATRIENPAASLQVRSASDYNIESNALASRGSNQALLLAKSAQSGLDQLLAKVEQMKEIAKKGAATGTGSLDRAFLRMDLADLYKDYNAIASSTVGDLVGGLSGNLSVPVQVERVGDSLAAHGFSSFSLSSLSRPMTSGDQFRLKVGTNPEAVYVANRPLFGALPPTPADLDADGIADDPQEEASWQATLNTAGAYVLDALQGGNQAFTAEPGAVIPVSNLQDASGIAQLEAGWPLQFGDTLLFASNGYVQFLTLRAFLPVSVPGSQAQPGTTSIAYSPTDSPIQLRSLADTRIRALEIGENAIVSFGFLTQGGAGYLSGADASNVPITLTGGTGQGGRGFGDLTGGSFTSLLLPYRGSGYSVGDQLEVSLADLASHGAGFSATITNLGLNGEIDDQSISVGSVGSNYLGGGSGTRVPVNILQTQTDPNTGTTNVISSAKGLAKIEGGEITEVLITSRGNGYLLREDPSDPNSASIPVTAEVDLNSTVSKVKLKVMEVGNGNLSPDTFIYDAAYRSLDAIAGRAYLGTAGRDSASAPSQAQFQSALSSLETLKPVIEKQALRAKLEVERLESQVRSFGGQNSDQKDSTLLQSPVPAIDIRAIKLTRLLSRVSLVEFSMVSLPVPVQSQSTPGKFDWIRETKG
jgi:hypothetical protein